MGGLTRDKIHGTKDKIHEIKDKIHGTRDKIHGLKYKREIDKRQDIWIKIQKYGGKIPRQIKK